MPPIDELTRIEPVLLARLDRMGIFTTGLLLEVSETPTRRITLADQVGVTTNDVNAWRDEALLLNLAGFSHDTQVLFAQAGIIGLEDLLELDLDAFAEHLEQAASMLEVEPPTPLMIEGWWDQAQTLAET